MIPLVIPNLTGNEGKYLQDCIESTFVSSVGPYVKKFEAMVSEACGAKFAVATSSGTAGLHLALVSLGVNPGCLVILPSFTFIASANAISLCHASPWILDIDPASWTLDADLLKRTIASKTHREGKDLIHSPTGQRVAAIMPVYTLGSTADMDSIQEVANEYDLPIVADAAAALGADYKGKPLGELADLTIFSFNGNKTVTSGGGGMIVGNDERLMKFIRHLSTQARVGKEYHHDHIGFNYRMTNIQAAVGCAQMERLEEFIQKKIRIRETYDNAFKEIEEVGIFPRSPWGRCICWYSGILIEDNSLPKVSVLCHELEKRGIEARSFWKPIHLQPPYKNMPQSAQPVSEKIWEKILTLPCSTNLTETDQNQVISTVKTLLS